jgi:1-acyl-sn-glycerol-3-phosphate acyltransferase
MLRGLMLRLLIAAATLAIGLPVAVLVGLGVARPDLAMRAGRVWSRLLLRAAGARPSYEGLEHVAANEPRVYIANHQSSIDIWALTTVLPVSARFAAKQELFRLPVFGWVLRAGGFISIDRGNRADAIRSLERAAERVRAGTSLILFAEGTRSRSGRLLPFKKGAFHFAVRAGVPVVPVAIGGSFVVMPTSPLAVRPGPVRVAFAPPLDPRVFGNDHEALRHAVREVIAARLAVIDPRAVAAETDRAPGSARVRGTAR